nr:hypothetical protein [uncultured bacterium]
MKLSNLFTYFTFFNFSHKLTKPSTASLLNANKSHFPSVLRKKD